MKRLIGVALTLALFFLPAAGSAESVGAAWYAVQPGDTVESIAALYNADEAAVRLANIVPEEGLRPGQVLRVPVPAGDSGEYASLFVSPNRTRPAYTAAHFGAAEETLAALNFFPRPGTVLRGQILKIPLRTAASALSDPGQALDFTYIVQTGDTLQGIAAAFSLTETDFAARNRLTPGARLWPGLILRLTPAAENAPAAYVVQKGDSLARIARRFSVTADAIAAANDLPDPALLVLGQVLLVPLGE